MSGQDMAQGEPGELRCTTLDSRDEYALYFNQLYHAFTRLLGCYPVASGDAVYEAHCVQIFITKLLYTIETLRMKYTYNPAHSLKVDLAESGFPSFIETSYLAADLLVRQQRLIDLPPAAMLRQAMLDHMFKHAAEPSELLWQMSARQYFEMLDEQKLFLPFTPGRLELRGENGAMRTYAFSWACYDFASNSPYIHVLTFDQDAAAERLEWSGAAWQQFVDVVRAEGSRAPDVGIIALAIDDYLESVHPKVLKRLCIGPLHSKATANPAHPLCRLLEQVAGEETDFILELTDEIVFSQRTAEVTARANSPKRVREVFFIPETDLECYDRKASTVHRYLLLPFAAAQLMEDNPDYAAYSAHGRQAYDSEGKVHGL
jgi:hypothetical protein